MVLFFFISNSSTLFIISSFEIFTRTQEEITNQVSSNHYGSNGIERRKAFCLLFSHIQESLPKKEIIIASKYAFLRHSHATCQNSKR